MRPPRVRRYPSGQGDLFGNNLPEPERAFGGETYEPERDYIRLTGQLQAVYEVMKDGRWRTLRQISDEVQYGTEAAISARLRDFRKGKFGRHGVERENLGGGLWRYRLILKESSEHE